MLWLRFLYMRLCAAARLEHYERTRVHKTQNNEHLLSAMQSDAIGLQGFNLYDVGFHYIVETYPHSHKGKVQ